MGYSCVSVNDVCLANRQLSHVMIFDCNIRKLIVLLCILLTKIAEIGCSSDIKKSVLVILVQIFNVVIYLKNQFTTNHLPVLINNFFRPLPDLCVRKCFAHAYGQSYTPIHWKTYPNMVSQSVEYHL